MAAQGGLRRGFGRMVSDSFAGIARRVQGADDLGGGRQLALIARELVQGPLVVMLDEPTASLASTTGQADARNSSPGDVGVLVKFTTHDPRPEPGGRFRGPGISDAATHPCPRAWEERARVDYLYARALVGREFAKPASVRRALHRVWGREVCREWARLQETENLLRRFGC